MQAASSGRTASKHRISKQVRFSLTSLKQRMTNAGTKMKSVSWDLMKKFSVPCMFCLQCKHAFFPWTESGWFLRQECFMDYSEKSSAAMLRLCQVIFSATCLMAAWTVYGIVRAKEHALFDKFMDQHRISFEPIEEALPVDPRCRFVLSLHVVVTVSRLSCC